MSLPSPDVIIIRGAPGVGKSTLAKELAKYFPKGVRLEVDLLRNMLISVDWTNQQEHKDLLQVAAQLTRQFLGLGYNPVIVVDTFSGDKVDAFLASIADSLSPAGYKLLGLTAREDVLRTRLEARLDGAFRDIAIALKLNKDVAKVARPEELSIDTASLSLPDILALLNVPSGGRPQERPL